MSAKRIFGILAILLGLGLIIGGFIIFGDSLEDKVRVLDIIVSCVIYIQLIGIAVFPIVDTSKESQKEVGMMGIHYSTLTICCILSLAWMVVGILYDISFTYQLMGQLEVLFFLFLGRVTTLQSGEKVASVYAKEKGMMAGKVSLRREMDDMMADLANVSTVDNTVKQRLQSLQDSMRFLTPSSESEAMNLEAQILALIDDLKFLTKDPGRNNETIREKVGQLETIFMKRKKY